MRDWLTVIIVLLIAGVVLDGLRRMRNARREAIRMSLSTHKGLDKDELDNFGSELPNGGARVVGVRDENDARALTQSMQEKHRQSKTTCGLNRPLGSAARSSSVDEADPLLDDYLGSDGRLEPTITSEDLNDDSEQVEAPRDQIIDEVVEDVLAVAAEADASEEEYPAHPDAVEETEADEAPQELEQDPLFAETRPLEPIRTAAQGELFDEEDEDLEQEEDPEEVLVINVMAGKSGMIRGEELLDVCVAEGLRFGEREIFHRYENKSGGGPLLFSMVNMVKPGTFDLEKMTNFETPGVSLFMALPMKANSVEAFNQMAVTAAKLAETLGAELKDETRSAMTNQTLEHCRQRIIEFERKRQLTATY